MMSKTSLIKLILILYAVFCLSIVALTKDKAVNSRWAEAPVKIDGSHLEWPQEGFTHNKKVNVEYAFLNDAEYLYVLFIFKDPRYLSSINLSGMTIYHNTEGKKKKDYGIRFYKMRLTADQLIAILEKQQGPLPDEKKAGIRARNQYSIHQYKVINKDHDPSSPESSRPEAKKTMFTSAKIDKMTVYEFAIPLEKAAGLAPGIGTEPGQNLKIGFEWGGLTEEMKKQRLTGVGAQSTRATGDRATGLTQERSSRPRDSAGLASVRKRSPKKYDFWVDVKLAQD